jgi:hypothetical protein
MSKRKDIEDFAVNEFGALLVEYGYAPGEVEHDDVLTRIDFLRRDLAVEIELDWREFMAFVLLVHLKNGMLPDGYYVADGKTCRKHLGRVLQEQGRKAPPGPRVDRGQSTPRNTADLKTVLLRYKEQLAACIEDLNSVGAMVFS